VLSVFDLLKFSSAFCNNPWIIEFVVIRNVYCVVSQFYCQVLISWVDITADSWDFSVNVIFSRSSMSVLFSDETLTVRVTWWIELHCFCFVLSSAPTAMSWVSDLAAVVRGLQRVNRAFVCQRRDELQCFWSNSSLRPIVRGVCDQVEDVMSDVLLRQSSSKVCWYSVYFPILYTSSKHLLASS